MKSIVRLFVALVMLSGLAFTAHAQASTYAIGSSTCSKTAGIYCYGIPLNAASQTPANVWLDVNSTAQWLLFGEGLSHLGKATINQDASYQPKYGTVHSTTADGRQWSSSQITSLSLTYYGTDSSGSGYNGAMTISFDYYYVDRCSSGLGGCGALGWHRRVIGGSTTFAIANY